LKSESNLETGKTDLRLTALSTARYAVATQTKQCSRVGRLGGRPISPCIICGRPGGRPLSQIAHVLLYVGRSTNKCRFLSSVHVSRPGLLLACYARWSTGRSTDLSSLFLSFVLVVPIELQISGLSLEQVLRNSTN